MRFLLTLLVAGAGSWLERGEVLSYRVELRRSFLQGDVLVENEGALTYGIQVGGKVDSEWTETTLSCLWDEEPPDALLPYCTPASTLLLPSAGPSLPSWGRWGAIPLTSPIEDEHGKIEDWGDEGVLEEEGRLEIWSWNLMGQEEGWAEGRAEWKIVVDLGLFPRTEQLVASFRFLLVNNQIEKAQVDWVYRADPWEIEERFALELERVH